jgi:hypothetical protein
MGTPLLIPMMAAPSLKGSRAPSVRPPSGKMSAVEALQRLARIDERDRDVAGQLQMMAHQRDLEQALFRHEAEVAGELRQQRRRVRIAAVVAGEDVVLAGGEVFQAGDLDVHAHNSDEHLRPDVGHDELAVTVFIE